MRDCGLFSGLFIISSNKVDTSFEFTFHDTDITDMIFTKSEQFAMNLRVGQ